MTETDNGLILPEAGKIAEIVYELSTLDDLPLTGFDVGGRFSTCATA